MPNKEYRACVYCGMVNGKPKTKTIRANSQRELNQKVKKAKAEISEGKDICAKATFGIWADKWLNEKVLPSGVGTGVITQYKSAIKHLNRYFEYEEFKNITYSAFQCMINELTQENPNSHKPTSKRTLVSIKNTASAIFRYARTNNIAYVNNYFDDITISKKAPKEERRALTEEEQHRIIFFKHRCQCAAMIMMFSGIRRGELIPLEWSDIDLHNGIISINKSVEFDGNTPVVKKGGKSKSATRLVPIPRMLVCYLRDYKYLQNGTSKLVCTNASGKMHTKSSWRKMWDSYMLDMNIAYGYPNQDVSKFNPQKLPMKIERFTPHYLRHTFSTMLYLQGVDLETAKQYLGHSNIQVTSDIYNDLRNNQRFKLSKKYKYLLANEYGVKVA